MSTTTVTPKPSDLRVALRWVPKDSAKIDHRLGGRPCELKTVAVEPKMRKAEGNNVLFAHGCGSKWDGRSMYCSWYA